MNISSKDRIVVAVSARALFNMDEEHSFYLNNGMNAYIERQRGKESEPLKKGAAFPLISRLLNIKHPYDSDTPLIEVVILSGIHPDIGIRVLRSLDHYNLNIKRSAFTGGRDTVPYLSAYDVNLFLSCSRGDTQRAINQGIPSALMYSPPRDLDMQDGPICLAFDGDAVLFSPESEIIYKTEGYDAFIAHEREKCNVTMEDGPLARFLRRLNAFQKAFERDERPFRIALVTMRSGDAKERAIRTLRTWGVELDEAFFLGGVKKDKIISVLRPHIFFDDQDVHLRKSSEISPSGLVPYHQKFDNTILGSKNTTSMEVVSVLE